LSQRPFPAAKITHIRARLYRYQFASPEAPKAAGEWWERQFLGNFSVTVTLQGSAKPSNF
jgi:hypothetical protein